MRRILLVLALAAPVAAQTPSADYNRARAYAHYLNSTARAKTISTTSPGQVWGYDTPVESARFRLTPGYYHEETLPSGRTSFGIAPELSGRIVIRVPLVYPESSYPAWGYPESSYQGPGYQGPGYQGPGYQGPGYQGPTYQGSTYQGPAYPTPGYPVPANPYR